MRMEDGVEPVGDDENRPVLHQQFQCLSNLRLAFWIKAGGRLVKDQQRGVLEKGASDSETLRLACT